ncbi:MAG: sulfite oxidase-like oxidoreductase [bacterium]|nr:sulfite oxidase-like oxidoreductase [bacterium]
MDGPSRRELLAGIVAAGGWLVADRFAQAADPQRALVARVSRPQDLETPGAALDAELTPNDLFFVRSHFGPAILDERTFRLEVGGLVDRPLTLTLDDLRRLPRVTVPAVLQCAGNGRSLYRPRVPGAQWARGAVGQARWTGVRLADVLARAGIRRDGKLVRLAGGERPPMPQTPRFVRSLPVAKALHPSTLLAFEMNGAPLPLLHGAPLRAVVPGWVGDDWVKWLRSIRVEPAEDAGFYMKTGYRMPEPPLQPGQSAKPAEMRVMTSLTVKSLITRPLGDAILSAAPTIIAGAAFAGERSVRSVEVSVDGGRAWRPAALDPPKGIGAWQRWQLPWTPSPGRHRLLARAVDSEGTPQPERPAWNPGGYLWNGWDVIDCEVRA